MKSGTLRFMALPAFTARLAWFWPSWPGFGLFGLVFGLCGLLYNQIILIKNSFGSVIHAVNMVKRVCRDCPIPNCGAKYLVRLANHLADVHLLDISQRRKYLQEAKLQPKVKFVVYESKTDEENVNKPSQEQDTVYELVRPRQCKTQEIAITNEKNSETILKPKAKAKTQRSSEKATTWLSMY